jgi:NADPH2:quinone reductase
MGDSAVHLGFYAGDFAFKRLNPRLQFLNGKRVEILLAKQRERISGLFGEKFVQIHTSNVDARPPTVNMAIRFRERGWGINMAAVPNQMTAIDMENPGGPEVLQPVTRLVPVPGPGEVLVKVAAAGVNRPDIIQRKGFYPPPPGAPSIPGLEIAGEIVRLGEGVDDAVMGQSVCALVSGGGYAEYCAAPVVQCLSVPGGLSMQEAAALPETLFTVWHNLFERAYAREGETALVHGGTSGIGSMAIMLGKLFGLTVIVTCGSDEKCAAAKEIGAAHAINYKTQDFVEEVKRVTGGAGVEIVLDMVAGDYVARNLQCLKEDGRHVTIAVQGGLEATINMAQVMSRRLMLTGSTLRARSVEFKGLLADEIQRNAWPFVEKGELRPVMDQSFPLVEAAAAHARMEAGAHIGKIVLEI